MKKTVVRVALSLAFAAGLVFTGGSAANASIPVDGAECTIGHTVSGTTSLTYKFTINCTNTKSILSHGITISGPNGKYVIKTGECWWATKCTVTTPPIANPAGSQQFQYSDEYRIVLGDYDSGIRKYYGKANY